MSFSVTINVDGLKEVQGLLKRIKASTMNLNPVLRDFGEHMRRSVEKDFQKGGDPPWKKSKKAKGKTLIASAVLKNSITPDLIRGGIVIGTNVPYAAIHQFGGTIPAHKVTAGPGKVLPIPIAGATLISAKTGRAMKGQAVIFRMSAQIPEITMPARPFLVFHDKNIDYFHRSLKAYVVKGHLN